MVTPARWAVRIVVPARDESDLLPACLSSLTEAVAAVVAARPGTSASVTLVLDRCVDDSAEVASRFDGIDVLDVDHGRVGAARAAGVRHATRGDTNPSSVWIANTDADCVVPLQWLIGQLALADRGHDAVVGTVEPHGPDLDEALLAAWRARHERRDGHGHVHGANLGLTLAAYHAAGGFPDAAAHEDVVLVDRLRRSGVRWFAAGSPPVSTSGRREGRAPEGFAGYLSALGPVEPTA